jgi:hypothetical protein
MQIFISADIRWQEHLKNGIGRVVFPADSIFRDPLCLKLKA